MRIVFYLAFLFFFSSIEVSAAPATRSHVCEVVATVESIDVRKEGYDKPESWREAWGLPEFQIYTDVKLSVVAASLIEEQAFAEGECTPQKLPEIFQLRNDIKPSKIPVGTCLKGKTQFSGDEFVIGHWLFEVEVLESSDCSETDR